MSQDLVYLVHLVHLVSLVLEQCNLVMVVQQYWQLQWYHHYWPVLQQVALEQSISLLPAATRTTPPSQPTTLALCEADPPLGSASTLNNKYTTNKRSTNKKLLSSLIPIPHHPFLLYIFLYLYIWRPQCSEYSSLLQSSALPFMLLSLFK